MKEISLEQMETTEAGGFWSCAGSLVLVAASLAGGAAATAATSGVAVAGAILAITGSTLIAYEECGLM